MVEVESSAPEETERVARALARELAAGDVVTVSGELGSGKTTFVRGACRELGVTAPVTSPTFTIGHRYEGRVVGRPAWISHLDFFRFEGMSDAEWGDLERYFEDALVFVEWPEAAAEFLPAPRVAVTLRHLGGDRRLIVVESRDEALEMAVSADARARV